MYFVENKVDEAMIDDDEAMIDDDDDDDDDHDHDDDDLGRHAWLSKIES